MVFFAASHLAIASCMLLPATFIVLLADEMRPFSSELSHWNWPQFCALSWRCADSAFCDARLLAPRAWLYSLIALPAASHAADSFCSGVAAGAPSFSQP